MAYHNSKLQLYMYLCLEATKSWSDNTDFTTKQTVYYKMEKINGLSYCHSTPELQYSTDCHSILHFIIQLNTKVTMGHTRHCLDCTMTL